MSIVKFPPEFFFPSHHRRPYYIVAPEYTRYSAGARVLYLLCHALNRLGQTAFIHGPSKVYDLNAPLLNQQIVDYHFSSGRTPITVYPEVIHGNPYGAEFCVRYLLNFPGVLGGPCTFPAKDFILSFSKTIQDQYHGASELLCIPTVDINVFNDKDLAKERNLECYYLKKRRASGVPLKNPPLSHWQEIPWSNRGQSSEISREDLARMLKSSKRLYVYENTSLAIDAVLCGCPVVLMVDDFETDVMVLDQMKTDGFAFGNSQSELKRAEETVGMAIRNYSDWSETAGQQLLSFIEQTQELALDVPYKNKFKYDYLHSGPIRGRMNRALIFFRKRFPRLAEEIRSGLT